MESIHYLLMKSHAMMHRKIFAEAQKIGLTSGQPKVLDYLWEHEGSDQRTIASYCEIEPATLGSILLRMEQKGLIERRQEKGNRRSLFVYLTPQGRQTARQMQEIFTAADQQAAARLEKEELDQLKALLTKVCGTLVGEEG